MVCCAASHIPALLKYGGRQLSQHLFFADAEPLRILVPQVKDCLRCPLTTSQKKKKDRLAAQSVSFLILERVWLADATLFKCSFDHFWYSDPAWLSTSSSKTGRDRAEPSRCSRLDLEPSYLDFPFNPLASPVSDLRMLLPRKNTPSDYSNLNNEWPTGMRTLQTCSPDCAATATTDRY
jgi:hypothetical protein